MATSEVESESNRKPLLNNGSFAYMLGKYGFEFKNDGSWHGYGSANPSNTGQNLHLSPFFMALAGQIRLAIVEGYGALSGVGRSGWLWSKTASEDIVKAYYVQAGGGQNVHPVVYDWRLWAFSLRYTLMSERKTIHRVFKFTRCYHIDMRRRYVGKRSTYGGIAPNPPYFSTLT